MVALCAELDRKLQCKFLVELSEIVFTTIRFENLWSKECVLRAKEVFISMASVIAIAYS